MSEIEVSSLGHGEFEVQVREGDASTIHRVTVPDDVVDAMGGAAPSQLVEESFGFLLEREPASAILRQFSLRDISRYFPEYTEELQRRLQP